MDNSMMISVTNPLAMGFLRQLEDIHFIKMLPRENTPKAKLSDKYRGILTRAQGSELNKHINQMRSEWNDI